MKKAFLAAAVLVTTSAQATSGLDFGDLNYFLKQDQFNLTSNMNVVDYDYTDEGSTTDLQTRGYVLDNRLGFGVMDNLNVFAGLDYAYKNETETNNGGSPDSVNDGFSNPYFGGNYRLLNQSDSVVNVDFGAVARVSLMDDVKGFGGKDGNYIDGRHSLELNTAIGRKWNEANEWRLTAAVIQHFSGTTETKDSTVTFDEDKDASTNLALTAAYQYRPVQEFMMAVNLQAIRVGEVESDLDTSPTSDRTYKARTDFNFNFSAKYLITEKFIAKFNYGLSRLAEFNQVTSGSNSEQKDRHLNYYGIGIDWLF